MSTLHPSPRAAAPDVAERLERAFDRHADRPALRIGDAVHGYAALHRRVLTIRRALERAVPAAERLIGVVAGAESLDGYAALLAVLHAGRAFVPMNPAHPSGRNRDIVLQSGVRFVIDTSTGAADRTDRESGVTWLGCPPHGPDAAAPPLAPAAVAPDDLAYLLFTSGSTGRPKGVPITRGNLGAFLAALIEAGCDYGPDDRVLQMFDPTFDFSIASYLAPWCAGACVYPVPSSGGAKFTEIYRLLDEHALTVAPLVPSVLAYLRPYFDDIALPRLRLAYFCGEALRVDLMEGWARCAPAARILNFYGPTEATVFATVYRRPVEREEGASLNGVVAIGRGMDGVHVRVADERGAPVAAGEAGELCLAGAQITPGYWRDPERDARTFLLARDAADGVSRRYYRTGDRVRLDRDGELLFCGRIDQQVKLQGFRVELGEIEFHARALLGERQAVVVPAESAAGTTIVVLLVEGTVEAPRRVLAGLRERLPPYMVPARLVCIDRLPLNANGKVDRAALARGLPA